jgi:hypothetical protein
MCSFFALRYTPDTHPKMTSTIRVIYSTPNNPTKTKEINTDLHHDVFRINTQPEDLHPYASPEGFGITPYEGYQWWPKTGPLGAAMRLTALRKSPKEITRHPKNSRHQKMKTKPPDPPKHVIRDKNSSIPTAGSTIRRNMHGVRYNMAKSCTPKHIPLAIADTCNNTSKSPLRAHIPKAELVDRAGRAKDRIARPGRWNSRAPPCSLAVAATPPPPPA